MTNVVKRLLYDEQKKWFNKNNWSIFQSALVSKGATTYRYPLTSISGIQEKLSFSENIKEPWQQIGEDIDGEATGDESGGSVSLSANGLVMAIGAELNNDNGGSSGHVRVYQYNGSMWEQRGEDISGEKLSNSSGRSVSLNAVGDIVAIGAPQNQPSGHVRIYQYREYTDQDQGKFHYESREVDTNQTKPLIITEDFNTPPQVENFYWTQLGLDIDGDIFLVDFFRDISVSLSGDGLAVAIGVKLNDGVNGVDSGHVRVYEYNGSSWQQKGVDIDGEAAGDQSGYSVSLSADGSIVAIGAPLNDGDDQRDSNRGHVRVYQFREGSWQQLGGDIDGEAEGDESGVSVSLNADGSIVAIGAHFNDGNGIKKGHVRIYEYNGSSWEQKGGDIDGEAQVDRSGISVSLSADGSVVAIGSVNNDGDGDGDASGHVRVYKYSPRKTDTDDNGFVGWHKIGLDIDGEGPGDDFGFAVSLSADGSIVAIGAPRSNQDSGHVRVYRHNVLAGISQINHFNANTADIAKNIMVSRYGPQWEQVGDDIEGEAQGNLRGYSLSQSEDGSVLAIGAYGIGNLSGHVRVYQYNGSSWEQKGGDIDGDEDGDRSGWSVSLSADGSFLAIGAPLNDDIGISSGLVRVYQYNDSDSSWQQIGQDINGEASGDMTGYSVSFSAGGRVVAIGASLNDANGSASGHVRVYELKFVNFNFVWEQIGENINGEDISDRSGGAVSLSADGTILAVGARYNDGNSGDINDNRGHVKVYKYNGASWVQRGGDIDGEAPGDFSGYSLSLSADGSIVAIGAKENDGNGANSGHVRIYQYNNDTENWQKLGEDIDGEAAGDESGRSVSLSADGSIVAVGAYKNDGDDETDSKRGHVCVYQYNGSSWQKLGRDIDGEAEEDWNGFSVSLSADGSILAVGAPGKDETTSGHVRVFQIAKRNPWVQQGLDIDGEALSDQSGQSVSLSADGTVIAIGAQLNDGDDETDSNRGHVRVYQIINGLWKQKGGDIDGEAHNDRSGLSVSLSADGSVVAIGAYFNDGNGANSGHVRVYQYNNDTENWQKLGEDIDGEDPVDISGESVSLSADGLVVAIGARYNNDNGVKSGHVRVYAYNGSSWVQRGVDIDGEEEMDQFGESVSLSADGQVVAIGARLNDGNGDKSGHVRVYEFKEGSWQQKGKDIDGEAEGDYSGESVSLSADGSIVAIGAIHNEDNGHRSGHVRVYEFKEGSWQQLGEDIDGEAPEDLSGNSVSLSADGSIVAIGAINNDGSGSNSGHVRVYQYDGSSWVQRGGDIDGEAQGDLSGESVSLSADGSILAIGAHLNSGNGSYSGHVRVYKFTGWGLGT